MCYELGGVGEEETAGSGYRLVPFGSVGDGVDFSGAWVVGIDGNVERPDRVAESVGTESGGVAESESAVVESDAAGDFSGGGLDFKEKLVNAISGLVGSDGIGYGEGDAVFGFDDTPEGGAVTGLELAYEVD